MGRKPQRIHKDFVRGKNYEAVVVSPPKGFETPPDKISKKLLTRTQKYDIINTVKREKTPRGVRPFEAVCKKG